MKKILLSMAIMLFSGAAFAESFTPEQKKEIENIMVQYLQDNPKIVLEALEKLQQQLIEEKEAAAKKALKDNKKELETGDLFIGNKDGEVIIVKFFDYNCGYCRTMGKTLKNKIESDNNIKVILKELPSLGPESIEVSKVAIATGKQGKYAELYTKMMNEKSAVTKDKALTIAKNLGLDMDKLKQDMEAKETMATILKNRQLATELGSQAVPLIIIGDVMITGAVNEKELDELVKNYKK